MAGALFAQPVIPGVTDEEEIEEIETKEGIIEDEFDQEGEEDDFFEKQGPERQSGLPARAGSNSRSATFSIWGGYTAKVFAEDANDFEKICDPIPTGCTSRLGGAAGGIELFFGNKAQFGISVQYLQVSLFEFNGAAFLGPLVGTLKYKYNNQFLPIMGTFKGQVGPMILALSAGYAADISSVTVSFDGIPLNTVGLEKRNGFVAQGLLGFAMPLGDGVSFDIIGRFTMLTVFSTQNSSSLDSSSTNTTSSSQTGFLIAPGAALSFHF